MWSLSCMRWSNRSIFFKLISCRPDLIKRIDSDIRWLSFPPGFSSPWKFSLQSATEQSMPCRFRRKPKQVQGCCIMLLFLCSCCEQCSEWQDAAAAWVFHKCLIMSWYHAALFILWHWWRYGSMQCLHCSDFASNPARPFLFGLVGCSHAGSLQNKPQNWRPCPSGVQNQQDQKSSLYDSSTQVTWRH